MIVFSAKRECITLHPVAELHWKTVIKKYYFTEPEQLEIQWTSGCHEHIKFMCNPSRCEITATWRTSGVTSTSVVACRSHFHMQSLIADGYIPYKTLYCKDERLAVFSMIKSSRDVRKKNYAIVCLDVESRQVLACLPIKSSDQKECLNHVEVWSCDLSQDGHYLGMAVSLMAEENFFHQSCENFISIFDVVNNREVKRVWNWNPICSSIAFDPRGTNDRFALVAMQQTLSEEDCSLATYDLDVLDCKTLQRPVNRCLVNSMIDEDGETCFQVSYSREGYYIILQAMENVAYAREWLCNTYIYQSDSLQLLFKCHPTVALACHIDCRPRTRPILSSCGCYMALGSFQSKQTRLGSVDIEIYKLSAILDLRHQCRVAILRAIATPAEISQLPLPRMLLNYLMWLAPDRPEHPSPVIDLGLAVS